jgi:hypothetical protein
MGVGVACLVFVLFSLSQAPICRLRYELAVRRVQHDGVSGATDLIVSPGRSVKLAGFNLYSLNDWLLAETPLREPLLGWADLFGVRAAFVHPGGPYLNPYE